MNRSHWAAQSPSCRSWALLIQLVFSKRLCWAYLFFQSASLWWCLRWIQTPLSFPTPLPFRTQKHRDRDRLKFFKLTDLHKAPSLRFITSYLEIPSVLPWVALVQEVSPVSLQTMNDPTALIGIACWFSRLHYTLTKRATACWLTPKQFDLCITQLLVAPPVTCLH